MSVPGATSAIEISGAEPGRLVAELGSSRVVPETVLLRPGCCHVVFMSPSLSRSQTFIWWLGHYTKQTTNKQCS